MKVRNWVLIFLCFPLMTSASEGWIVTGWEVGSGYYDDTPNQCHIDLADTLPTGATGDTAQNAKIAAAAAVDGMPDNCTPDHPGHLHQDLSSVYARIDTQADCNSCNRATYYPIAVEISCSDGKVINEDGACVCSEGTIEENGQCREQDEEEKSYGDSCTGAGPKSATEHPINYAIGNKFFIATDFSRQGVFPPEFRRTYNSLDKGWRHSYGQSLELRSAGEVAIHRPDGRVYVFILNNGVWTPDPDVVTRLSGRGDTGWTYRLRDNTLEHYDSSGRLVAIDSPSGQRQTLSYSDNDITVTGHSGDWLEITRNAAGQPTQLRDATGEQVNYAYTGGYLTRVTHADGTTTEYRYEVADKPWLITGIIDENGHRSHSVAYDTQGRAIMSELADGAERVEVSYHDDGRVTLTNALGRSSTFTFETLHGVRKIVHVDGEPTPTCQGTAMDYVYNDNGFLIEKTDAKGAVTRYTRDAHGLELSRTEAAGTPKARTITTEWDAERRLPLKVISPRAIKYYSYDSQGNLLQTRVEAVDWQ